MLIIYFLLIILIIYMVFKKKTKKQKFTVKYNKKNSSCKITNKKPSKKTIQRIKKCNDILVKKEKQCNCFIDKRKKKPVPLYEYLNDNSCSHKTFKQGCDKYRECRKYFGSFMSQYEPNYEPEQWKNPYIEGTHNCYAYFLDDKIPSLTKKCKKMCKKGKACKNNKECNDLKPQPGYLSIEKNHKCSKKLEEKLDVYTCPSIMERVMCDNMKGSKTLLKTTTFDERCPVDYYKGIAVVDSGQKRDMPKGHTYHFLRQDSSGRFSHKPGTLPVENVDAVNDPIYAPHLADKNYTKDDPSDEDGIHYDQNCRYFCIPRNYREKTKAI